MSNLYFSADELRGMKDTAESLMMDVCEVAFHQTGQDAYGHVPEVPGSGDWSVGIECSFDERPGSKTFLGDKTPLTWDASVRIPHATAVDTRGWVRIIMRFEEPCAAVEYTVVGVEQEGPSATRLLLRRVEP
jgi:hypothetical protein